MNIFLIIIAVAISLVGIAGSILPALPGAPLNFGALFLLYFINRGEDPSIWAMVAFGILTAFSLAADYYIPAHSVKRYGATTLGIVGAVVGLIVGFVVLNVIGLFIGTFVGAIVGELIAGKELGSAVKAGAAGVGGNLLAIVFKLVLAIGMTIYLLIKLF